MRQRTKLNELDELLAEFDYPAEREQVLDRCGAVTLVLADGEETVADVLEHSSEARFESSDELRDEIMQFLPQHAVGEPYQSEGEG
ncbi:hypothetical protein ACFO0N_17525 [Halobium salinum]|uniref:DUF2795 domain-containing protein n=1 Tax=Halobium salinum TaxID=1364940 RepID=A0ABD5PGU4_9EURY|nr:hypothetical protein [Halobium salinum]